MKKVTFILGGRYSEVEMHPVESSRIKAIGHKHELPIDYLIIEFNKGGTYSYHPVPKKIFAEFMTYDSPGKFFESHIKGKEYKFTKIKEIEGQWENGKFIA